MIIKCTSVFEEAKYDEALVKKSHFSGEQISTDTYYFSPGQKLAYHKHPESDQIFFIIKGSGQFYLDDEESEQVIDVEEGHTILAPANIWHQLINTGKDKLIASQVTKLPSAMVARK